MNDLEKELVFSQSVKAGKRIYYFDVKQSRNGDRYVSITESKKIVEGSFENPRISFEKHKLFLYKEDYEKFLSAFLKTLEIAKTGVIPAEESEEAAFQPESYATATAQTDEAKPLNPEPEEPVVEQKVAEEPEPVIEQPVVKEEPVSKVKSAEDSFKIDLDF